MAKTYTFDVSTPANADAPTGGAAAFRLLKNAIHERENQDHYWEKSGDTADVDNVGYHRKATLMKLAADPTAITDMGIVYTKDASGVPELFFRDEAGNVIQLTSGGALNVTSAFSSGDLLLTTRTGAISGWTDKSSTWADKFFRISATAGTTGGADTHTHTGPSHTHTTTVPRAGWGNAAGDTGMLVAWTSSPNTYATDDRTFTSSAAGTGVTGSGSNVPIYITARCYQKD